MREPETSEWPLDVRKHLGYERASHTVLLHAFKETPRYGGVGRFVANLPERFPMTVTGKIQKFFLRKQMAETFRRNEEEAAS